VSITADRVRQLIEQAGVSQRDFSEQVGLDNSKMSKSLSGARRFSSLDLARIADHSGRSVDWLLGGAESDLSLAARAAVGTENGVAVAEARRLSSARAAIAGLGYEQHWKPVVVPSMSGTHNAQGQSLAAVALARFAKVEVPLVIDDLPTAIEEAFGIDVAILDLGAGFDGLAVMNADAKLILISNSALPWRQRFTLAHELCHVLLGDNQGFHVDRDVLDREHSKEPSERRANAFAAALLMPTSVLRAAVGTNGLDQYGFADLACRLRVSPSALAIQLLTLRLIDGGKCDQFRALSAQRAAEIAEVTASWSADVAKARQGRAPGLLAQAAFEAYVSGDATLRPYANIIGADVDVLRGALTSTDTDLS
jgi:Zn-dependent peptidase ImmA (M78 family)/transcriptional regulator with XRE-family HTH domain